MLAANWQPQFSQLESKLAPSFPPKHGRTFVVNEISKAPIMASVFQQALPGAANTNIYHMEMHSDSSKMG
ncbi:hypothetical protein O6P43_021638 [Quillaja saponaria]|uniref:Uncharacterized protein n=1 Tax=Quillaja saponaria TaxID=32244 RepID=A0AAD7LBG6_QUISA|nr:hypothetical protein O6P43_021638 [Quillaja saponaria]